MINLSTGPLQLSKEVLEALAAQPISHRGAAFKDLFKQLTEFVSNHVSVLETYVLTGSGTLANEVMLQKIKSLQTKGLILNGGEFGNRLCEQANKLEIQFNTLNNLGFNVEEIEAELANQKPAWLLFCHCETSTGIVHDVEAISILAKKYSCQVFVDCMSTFGTMPLNLSNVAMATASSGKGVCSIPGLAFVFSNIESQSNSNSKTPGYMDLDFYKKCSGVPFTISSNLVSALFTAANQNLTVEKYNQLEAHSNLLYSSIQAFGISPFANQFSRVFTLQPKIQASDLGLILLENGISTSFESAYLKANNWLQIALFGNYSLQEIESAGNLISKVLKKV